MCFFDSQSDGTHWLALSTQYIVRSRRDFVLPDMLFFTLELPAAIDLHFMNPRVAQIELKLMYGLRVSEVTADVQMSGELLL